MKFDDGSDLQSLAAFIFVFVGKIECWASVGQPDRCPAFDFSATFGDG